MDEQPPGWYRDPEDARRHRYWDGQGWTAAHSERTEPVQIPEPRETD